MSVVVVANKKGGAGKTVTASALAGHLSRGGGRVLLVDMDPQGSLSNSFRGEREDGRPGLLDALAGRAPLPDAAHLAFSWGEARGGGEIWLVPSTEDLYVAQLRGDELRVALRGHVRPGSAGVGAAFDHAIVDTGPSYSGAVLASYAAADWLLVPCPCRPYGLQGLLALIRDIDMLRSRRLNPGIRAALLLVAMDMRLRVCQEAAEIYGRIMGELPPDVFRGLPGIRSFPAALDGAAAARLPLQDFAPRSGAAQDYAAAFAILAGQLDAGAPTGAENGASGRHGGVDNE